MKKAIQRRPQISQISLSWMTEEHPSGNVLVTAYYDLSLRSMLISLLLYER
jgi:hypothetical protein